MSLFGYVPVIRKSESLVHLLLAFFCQYQGEHPSAQAKEWNQIQRADLLIWCKLLWPCAGLLNRNILQFQSRHLLFSLIRLTLLMIFIPFQIKANLYLSYPHLSHIYWLYILIFYLPSSCPGKQKTQIFWKYLLPVQVLNVLRTRTDTFLILRHPTTITSCILNNWVQLSPKHMAGDVVYGRW